MSKNRSVSARSPEYEILGKNIANARCKMNLSQFEASEKIGISQSTYSGYETGTRRIKLSMLEKIASIYGVSVDQLIGSKMSPHLSLSLTDLERRLIIRFRELSDSERMMLLRSVGIEDNNK